VNNWDLVDLSAPKIVSPYLLDKPRNILYKLAKSKNLWERRIAIMGTAGFIVQNQFSDTLKISEMLLKDKHDLIHKAVGWMLREVGKRDLATEEKFLKNITKTCPHHAPIRHRKIPGRKTASLSKRKNKILTFCGQTW